MIRHAQCFIVGALLPLVAAAAKPQETDAPPWVPCKTLGATIGPAPIRVLDRRFNVQSAQKRHSIQHCIEPDGILFEAGYGDFALGQRDRVRAELQSTEKIPFGVPYAVAFSVAVDALPGIPASSFVIAQFHQTEDAGDFSGYPPLELNLKRDGLYIYTASVAEAIRESAYPKIQRAGPINFSLRESHEFRISVTFDWQGKGALDVLLDGKAIFTRSGISIGMNDRAGPYWKFGVYYQPNATGQRVRAAYRITQLGVQQ